MARHSRRAVAFLLVLFALLTAAPVAADTYDRHEAGHPLRIAAYVLHPVGVMLDWLLFRPAHWVVSHESMAYLFGHEKHEE